MWAICGPCQGLPIGFGGLRVVSHLEVHIADTQPGTRIVRMQREDPLEVAERDIVTADLRIENAAIVRPAVIRWVEFFCQRVADRRLRIAEIGVVNLTEPTKLCTGGRTGSGRVVRLLDVLLHLRWTAFQIRHVGKSCSPGARITVGDQVPATSENQHKDHQQGER